MRVDVSTSANGVLAVALSEQEKGFAPYRLDNCTALKLHLRYPLPHAFGNHDQQKSQQLHCPQAAPQVSPSTHSLPPHESFSLSIPYSSNYEFRGAGRRAALNRTTCCAPSLPWTMPGMNPRCLTSWYWSCLATGGWESTTWTASGLSPPSTWRPLHSVQSSASKCVCVRMAQNVCCSSLTCW